MPHLPREHSRIALLRLLGCFSAMAGLLWAQAETQHRVTAVRFWTLGDVTRVAIETDGQFEVLSDHLSDPERVFFDLVGTHPTVGPKNITVIPVGDKLIQQIRVAEPRRNVTRVVLDLQGVADVSTSRLENPHRLIIEVWRPGHGHAPAAPAVATATPTAAAPAVNPPPAVPPPPVVAAAPREPRQFRPPSAKSKPPLKHVQVALLDPPAVDTRPVAPTGLSAKIASDYANVSLPPYRRAVDLKHLPNPNEPEVGPRAYPTPKRSVEAAKVEPPKVEIAKVEVAETAELAPTRPTGTPETKMAVNHGDEVVTADKPAPPRRTSTTAADTALPAKRNATGDRSMIRVLGLKVGRIVLDAGHGGHDTGTVGPEGLREKDLVLDVTKRLGALIEDRMGSEINYTRSDDTFIPLERRTEIANEAKADLFLSIHANSSSIRTAAGVETYYLSFTTSKTALDLAARENAASTETVYDLQDILQKIALNDKVDESRDFAGRVQTALFALSAKNNKNSKDRGVRKAPFVVLIGANMPSVLAEIGFISNAHDESTMKRAEYRERIAEALYKGVSGYAGTLSHFQVAQRRAATSE
ncbi:MAG TPA: N-acetylmuramoyl-L-alanine amidase [Bryobacteraceae bacterium]|nr:N-acetylmuramoyl-L-alanine amidase [Bryobacteraceae bacterium]